MQCGKYIIQQTAIIWNHNSVNQIHFDLSAA